MDKPILAALEYLNSLDESTFKNIAEVNIGDPDAIMAYTVLGVQIRLGDGKDLPKKAELTQSMLQDIKRTHGNVQYIDVNVSSPYIKTDVMPEVKSISLEQRLQKIHLLRRMIQNKINKVMLKIKVDDCRETRTVGNCHSQLYIRVHGCYQYKMTQDNIEENIRLQRAGDLAVQLRGPKVNGMHC